MRRQHVPEDCTKADQRGHEAKRPGERRRHESFGDVEQQDRYGPAPADGTLDVGGPDVARALAADVNSIEPARNVPERN